MLFSLQRSFEDSILLHYCRENLKSCNDQLITETEKNRLFSENLANPTVYLKYVIISCTAVLCGLNDFLIYMLV
jgi:hypothetical protein